ncbi:hypothetical protein Sta7437_0769 [Stanieria cyanosphaera PCC 7437]|uniref:Kelch repeat type 1-containing protein n=1 Tax=Stanieria cyanosphaera (strain ATCC 29371 / PCC 7437) TaxID=111780 RepID=K9XP21_STAC7|nr:hypothetical protein [Stanieria cyanosphaera]AFZ34360.1 hypothetical protein Sta7437_0769 [Stanieria cyanosphaera PCC 7437]
MIRQKYRQKILLSVLLFSLTILILTCETLSREHYNHHAVVRLGNPSLNDGKVDRALNVWDLQVFDGKIYIAGGSTVNNAGPINVWAYNPATQSFIKEYTVNEEAIEHYKVFDNQLYIPAADPRGNDANKFYCKASDGQWTKYASNAVKLAHVRDLIETKSGDLLLVGNNRNPNNINQDAPGTAITTDNGASFQGAGVNNSPSINNVVLADYNWFFSVFSYQNKIYAPTSMLKDAWNSPGTIAVYELQEKSFILAPQLDNSEFIPQKQIKENKGKYGFETIYRIWHPVEFNHSLIYSVRSYSNSSNKQKYEENYMNSLGMYLKKGMGKTPEVVHLPHHAIGEDILVINNELYVLANRKIFCDRFIIYIYKTSNLSNKRGWQKVLSFKSSNKARSFEYLNGKFYFGLGQDYGEPINNSGEILSYTPT